MSFQQPNSPSNINYPSQDIISDINNNGLEGYDVVIIGAGLSGLYAANVLMENGVDNFVILEARSRVGGRTFTKKGENVGYVDLGASYVGPTQLYMQRLIKKLGLKTFKVNSNGKNVYLNKRKRFLHDCDSLPAMGSLVEMEVKHVFGLIERMCEEISLEAPWTAPQAHEWDRITFAQFLEKHCFFQESIQFVTLFMSCCTSCEAFESSLLWTLWFVKQNEGIEMMFNIEDCAQDSKIVDGTMQISERLQELIGGPERVLLNKPVVHIRRNDSQWPVTVCTLDGAQYHARYIIMAIPISLQQKIHFTPALPPLYNQMLQKMPMGSAIKFVTYYREAFWRRDGLTASMIINLPEDQGPCTLTIDDTKPDGSYPAIVGFIVGDRAKLMLQKSKEERLRIICDSYAKALGSEEARKPIYSEEKCWSCESYTGGCFTAFGVPGFLTTYGDLLRKPLFDDRIHLAGTETATLWSGYMDGACQAGERAALQVMQRLRVKVSAQSVLQQSNPALARRKKSLQSTKRERRMSDTVTQLVDGLGMSLSINQLLTWSGIVVASVVGFIITASF